MRDKTLNAVTKEFLKDLNTLADERLRVLDDFREGEIISRVLLQHEAKRIKKKFGKDHARTSLLKNRLKQNLELIKDLEVELEIARIRIPHAANAKMSCNP